MKKIYYYLPSIIFNVAETLVIILIGVLLKLDIKIITLITILFATTRMSLGEAMHYKDWYRCLVWSTLVFLSLLTCILCTICTHTLQAKEASSDQKLDSIELKLRETYTKREVMIPMRDGIKLYTAIYEPKREAQDKPILPTP